jgi:hypothetical protein
LDFKLPGSHHVRTPTTQSEAGVSKDGDALGVFGFRHTHHIAASPLTDEIIICPASSDHDPARTGWSVVLATASVVRDSWKS